MVEQGGLDEPEFSIKPTLILFIMREIFKSYLFCSGRKDGFCEEGADCYYPDMNSPFPEDHFEG